MSLIYFRFEYIHQFYTSNRSAAAIETETALILPAIPIIFAITMNLCYGTNFQFTF